MSSKVIANGDCGRYDFTVLCRNCEAEHPEPIQCELRGTLPDWLKGTVLYNGPGLTKIGNSEYRHAFDASALLQRFHIENGTVVYNNRYVRSNTYEANQAAGAIVKAEFGTPAPKRASGNAFSRLMNAMDPEKTFSDNALVSVVGMGNKFFALSETPFMIEIDPHSLETLSRVNVNKCHGLMTQSPHPIQDEDGYLYTMGQTVGLTGPKYSIIRYPPTGDLTKGKIMVSIPTRWKLSPSYMHSMALTENYVVLIEQPLAVSIMDMMNDIMSNSPFIEGLKWHGDTTLIHVIDRRKWKLVKTRYVTDPLFVMHIANAYEEDDHIVIDMPMYKDSSLLNNMFIHTLKEQRIKGSDDFYESFRSLMKRMVIPLVTKDIGILVTLPYTTCTAQWSGSEICLQLETLSETPVENPTINPSVKGIKHRHIWAMGPDFEKNAGVIVKIDTVESKTISFKEEHLYPGEPIFVPRPNAVEEDDGVILAMCVYEEDKQKGVLLVLDASTLTEIARAIVSTPSYVPMPLHGYFISNM
ncbi:carotenoid isomerooxygenase-like [Oratosquilla oratoria]|uniref:carotenoid isomerooxygenase-like n=1 Tax=Oratosquilla oratoria TaxID=337810 RepID=UPI003F76F9AC